MLNKGVPSTFPNIKALYTDPEKKAIVEELALGYATEKKANGSAGGQTNGDITDRFEQSVLYFLAQHYDYHLSRDLTKASEYISQLLKLNPKSVDYHQLEARILKHSGNSQKAADTMNEARLRDEKDRYINTKCAKYQLRNNQNELALQTMSKFTRNEATGGPLGDLHDMQCMWYLTEDGEAYMRQKDLGLALKRFTAVADIFDIWHEDQFDFHSFSLRKGQIRAYIDMIRWEDHIRDHPFFTRAAISAIKIYLILATQQELVRADETSEASQEITKERKKAEKKAKKALEKLKKEEEDRKAAAAKKATPKKVDEDEVKKEDLDPLGIKLTETKEPLEASLRFLTPLLEFSPKNIEAQNIGFEVHFRRGTTPTMVLANSTNEQAGKYLQALKCLNAAHALDPENPKVHEQAVRFRKAS
jgi:peptide alpha-N-acetyltransferase